MNLLSFDETTAPDEWLIERMRIHRDRLLIASDWAVLTDTPTDKKQWAEYRQALRDFPKTWKPTTTVDFPTPPKGN